MLPEAHQCLGIVWRAKPELQTNLTLRGCRIAPDFFAQLRRRQAVVLHKGRIESAQAAKARAHGDILHRQLRVSEQSFSRQEAMRLQYLQR